MIRILILVISFISITAEAAADFHAPDFRFTHLTTDNGLPSNRVRDIVEDSEGFMWFATEAGLVRYDGTTTKIFTPYAENSDSREVYIMSLCKDGDRLLVGTDRNLYTYCRRKERLTPLVKSYKEGVGTKLSGVVHDICVDSSGTVWASVEAKGIFRISKDGCVEEVYQFPQIYNFIGKLYVDSNDIVWGVCNSGEGVVMRFDKSSGRFEKFPVFIDGQERLFRARSITSDANNNFYLGTWEQGIVRFNGRTGIGKVYDRLEVSNVWHVHSMTWHTPATLLIGSDNGLTLLDVNSGEWKAYTEDELNPGSLNDLFVYPIEIDSSGGLWIGTFYRGINYQSSEARRFQRWRHSRFANSVSGNVVSRLCEDREGNIWIGTADGGLCRYNPITGVFTSYPLDGSKGNDNINAILADGDQLWIGTYTKGIGILDIPSGKWRQIPVDGEVNTSCYAICKDSNNHIWIGATEHFALYDPKTNSFHKIRDLKAWICDIDEDKKGNLWVATQGRGLFKYNPANGKWINFVASDTPGSLPHNDINSIKIDNEGKLYVSTIYGVYSLKPDNNNFNKEETGLDALIANSLEKVGNELWIGTPSGLVNVKEEGTSRVYTTSDGLSDNQFVTGASLMTSDGMLYYGTVNGFCMVDPIRAKPATNGPRVNFTGLDIINKPVEVGDTHLPESLNSISRLTLTHADHTFSIYFSAINYSNPEGCTYRYRLDGFDKSWIDAGNNNRATYSNMPPGKYTLRVKAADADGVWNEEGVSLPIEVKPAWYATPIMKTFYILMGVTLLLLFVRFIIKRMERNHLRELEQISANNEKEMYRSKLNFFTVVAHEIRTPVSLIIGPLEKVLESPGKFSQSEKDDLNIINRNAHRLLSLVNQLLDFRKVEDHAIPVRFRLTKIAPLIESISQRFRSSVEHKGGSLTVDCPDPDLTADVDVEALTKLVSNLLNNARKFTKDQIHVECRPLADGESFMISVSDNGIGISRENRDKVFKPFFQVLDNINESKGGTGLGLAIVKNVVEAHCGNIELESAPGKGSRFVVTLPLHQKDVVTEENLPLDSEESKVVTETQADGSANGKPTLLVVDDNEEMLHFISSNFREDYDVISAVNGRDALEKMKDNNVSLIISDWMMPVMDGVEFLKAVRENENFSHIPFVMLSAKTDNMSKIETMQCGADAYVEKPFSIGFLKARIENLLDMRRRLREKYSGSPLEPIESIAPTPLDNELLRKLQDIIEDNISNPDLNVDLLVGKMGMSRSSLYAKIKMLADVSPNELIQITRLKKGAELLKTGKYRVNEVSMMVGFSNTSYFSRCFSKQFGIKPTEWRE